jgi:hypothetical protein
MAPECWLPHSQVPTTCPYPEPARSSPYSHIQLPEDPSKYYFPIYAWVSQADSFPQVSPPKPYIRLSSPPYALHAPLISFFSILAPEHFWVRISLSSIKDTHIRGALLSGRVRFVQWHLIYVGTLYGTFCMSQIWLMLLWDGWQIFGKLLLLCVIYLNINISIICVLHFCLISCFIIRG